MEERILNEIRFTIDDMKEKTSGGEKILTRVDKYFDLPDLNVIWELVAGTRSVKQPANGDVWNSKANSR